MTTLKLSRRQAQALKSHLEETLTVLETIKKDMKKMASSYYDHCDRDRAEETADVFKDMNQLRDIVRGISKKQKSLADIQYCVKKYLTHGAK